MAYDEIYQQVIDDFLITGSVKQTAINVGTTLVRAQRILITEGLWSSKTSENIGRLYRENKSVSEIAGELYISEKTVQAYLPYTRNEKGYGGNNRSNEAIRSEDYRKRQQNASNNQVLNKELDKECKRNNTSYRDVELDNERSFIQKEELAVMYSEDNPMCKSEYKAKKMLASEYYDLYADKKHRVLKLSLKLNMKYMSVEDTVILNRYGRATRGITREILVPGDITLHALHYAIQRAFGWQNSHLHCFKLSNESFQKLTGGKNKIGKYGGINYDGKFIDWVKLCGIYFRYPTEDYEDIYWDDDYEEGISFKSWLRKKYTGPYKYGGEWEHYRKASIAAKELIKKYPQIDVVDYIHNSKTIKGRLGSLNEARETIPMREATIEDFQHGFEGNLDELLERVTVAELLVPEGMDIDEEIYLRVSNLCREQKNSLIDLPVLPVTDEIIYAYDYGAGWEVSIKMTDCYCIVDSKTETCQRAYNINQEYVDDEMLSKIVMVDTKQKPICIALDGLSVMDDVGGIHGYINLLTEIRLGIPSERDEARNWAKGMGWNGRMSKPENVL